MTPSEWYRNNHESAFMPDGHVKIFYPGGFQDYGPLSIFIDNGQPRTGPVTAIYADYCISIDQIFEFSRIVGRRYNGWGEVSHIELHPIDCKARSINDFYPRVPNDWALEQQEFYRRFPDQEVLGHRFYYHNIGLNLIYFQAEAISVYKKLSAIYLKPNVLVITEHGFGMYWTEFEGDSMLYRAVARKPKYLYVQENAEAWPNYECISGAQIDEGQTHNFERSLYRLRGR